MTISIVMEEFDKRPIFSLLDTLSRQLKEALEKPDPAAIQTLSDRLETLKNKLAAAIAESSPEPVEEIAVTEPDVPVDPDVPDSLI